MLYHAAPMVLMHNSVQLQLAFWCAAALQSHSVCRVLFLVTCPMLQAFQCSEQAVTLCKDGWFCPETEPSGVSKMRNPKEPSVDQPIIVVSKYRTAVLFVVHGAMFIW